ncbi:MAG: hypothetical protein NW218_00330 [Saprospiraceae bacterium]|nr:hypothetical protein [Saprospiraceae bacterium]
MKSFVTTTQILKSIAQVCCMVAFALNLNAQATLTVQGVLTKSDGTAVDDGAYSLTFRLWKDASSTNSNDRVHQETIGNVETVGGVYSVVLGINGTAITAPFDQLYYLGVSVGSSSNELLPRPLLTHAPYALSLIGQNNKFPSTGVVTADAINVAGNLSIGGSFNVTTVTASGAINGASLSVTGAVNGGSISSTGAISGGSFIGSSGAPNAGVAAKGYSFGGGGDQDGGMFSLGDNNVALYANAVKALEATNGGVTIPGNLQVSNGATINNNLNVNRNISVSGPVLDNTVPLAIQTKPSMEVYVDNNKLFEIGRRNIAFPVDFPLNYAGIRMYRLPDFNGKNMQWDETSGLIGADNSSRRYKFDIKPLEANFSAILNAEAKIYRRKSDSTRIEIGYIAEEMDSLGLKPLIIYDKEGRVEAFDYERMILYVTEVLKIQHKDIEKLQTEVAALKGEKSALTAANASLQKQQAEIGTQLDAILQKLKLLESGSKAGK